ncbi:phage tail tip lysozyme [Acidimangrovimonas sediminis]|uniref:phage tail tip lysozyme n=1 Tax=Acidimangrovimonas sediminis TaxID=2056283 RepID=UPI000C810083|nr:phage tail tip lysozyme [Acidimangrovimonas sediminis]
MTAQPFVFEMVFKADVAQAKAGATDVRAGVEAITKATREATGVSRQNTAALQSEAEAARQATSAKRDLAAQEAQARAQVLQATTGVAAGRQGSGSLYAMAAASLSNSSRNAALTSNAGALSTEIAATKEWRQELDRLRAEFNPLFAASRQYEQELRRIADAEQLGAISAREAGDARAKAAQIIAPAAQTVPTGPSTEEIRSRYVPLFQAQQQYEKELANIRQAEATGAITTDESALAAARLTAGYENTVAGIKRTDEALKGNTGQLRLNRMGMLQLQAAGVNSFQALAAGISPARVALMEGSQVIGAFVQGIETGNSSAGRFGTALKLLTSVFTPLRLAIGATTAAVALGVSAWSSYHSSIDEVEAAASGLGRAVAGSAQDMETAAERGAMAAGISVKAARSMEAAFLRTGTIGHQNFEQLIAVSRDFGRVMGTDAATAGQALSQMFADPAKAAETLSQKYGLIDASVAKRAIDLAQQNRLVDAQQLLVTSLAGRIDKATDHLTLFGRAWEHVRDTAKGAYDWMGRALDTAIMGPSRDEQIAQLQRVVDQINAGNARIANNPANAHAEARLIALQTQKALDEAQSSRDAAAQQGRFALNIANQSPATERDRTIETLQNQIAALQQGQGKPGLDADQQKKIADALETKRRVLQATLDAQSRGLQLDRLDIAMQVARDSIEKANIAAQRTRLDLSSQEISQKQIDIAAERARAKVMAETFAQSEGQIADMRDELTIRQRLDAQVATGAITADDANRKLQEELQLRPLITAAAKAEGAEKIRLNAIINQQRDLYAQLAQEQSRASVNDLLKSRREDLAQLQLEVTLLGSDARVRSRRLALFQAEQELRDRGLRSGMADYDRQRQELVATDLQTQALQRQIDAWGKVKDAAGTAIDDTVDKLTSGDISGAFSSLGKDLESFVTEMAVKNPLKNMLLGTALPTLDDTGGLGGIWDRLTGKASTSATLSTSGRSVASMAVTAASVTIVPSGNAIYGAGAITTANLANSPLQLSGAQAVQSQIWNYFSKKGLSPVQVAGIMGNVQAESGFNPFAVGDNGNALGLFQHNNRSGALLSALGGMGGLGNVQGQLDFVWKELMTSERSSLTKLLSATNVRDATAAFGGFERPSGYSAIDPTQMKGWGDRLSAANAALSQFGDTASSATGTLGQLGHGFGVFGQALSGALGNAVGGSQSSGNFLGTLMSSVLGFFGFEQGGWTGGSDPGEVRGVVHGREYVFDAKSTERIGVNTLDALRKGALRGYRDGGYVSGSGPIPYVPANVASQPAQIPEIRFVNMGTPQEEVGREQTTDSSGRQLVTYYTADKVGQALVHRGGGASKTMKRTYGLQKTMAGR